MNVFRPSDTLETFECWQLALESKNTPSVIALSRQKLEPIRKELSNVNLCSKGAYEIARTGDDIKVTLFATGSETNLACKISHKLATEKIYSKVVSMPCHEIFDLQNENYKRQILAKDTLQVSIEASETVYWKKYTGDEGLNFGLNNFGKSAPYNDIFDHFNLNVKSIVDKIKEKL